MATINKTSLFFALFGEGPPVLLLHGGLANSDYWALQIAGLAQNHRVIVMDTRGHGRSPVMSQTFGYATFAQDVVGLLNHLDIPSVSIIGWSDGAVTGLQLAMTNPTRVSKLFAFGANGSPSGYRASSRNPHIFAEFAGRCRAEYAVLSPRPEKWPQLLDGLRPMWRTEPNFTKQMLGTLKLPVTISGGEYDEIIGREHMERVARDIPGARFVLQPEVSHFAMLQNAPQFNRTIVEFLQA